MALPRIGLFLLLMALAMGAAATDDQRWYGVTVITIDGTVYEDVELTWKLDGFLLRLLDANHTETDLNPRIVANIVTADGRDITREVADASPSTADFTVLGDLSSEPFVLAWSLDAGGSAGFTSGYGGLEASGAWFAGLRRGLGDRFHLRLQYRSQYVRERVPAHGAVLATWTDELSLLVGYRPIHPRRNRNLIYLELGPVAVRWRQGYDPRTGLLVDSDVVEAGVVLRGGVLFPLSSRFGLDVGSVISARPPLASGSDKVGWVLGLNVALAVF